MNPADNPIVVEETFDSPATKVWDAITKLEEMRQWFFRNIPAFEPIVGFETEFSIESGNRNFHHVWKLLEVEPGKKITYHWSYTGITGEGIVTFELSEADEQTTLRVTNEGLESFPQDIPEFSRESCTAGWEYFIRENLKTYLEKHG